ncbi:MAG: hypothetical protein AAF821_15935, partial [Cyanobacteria bacterium P01_D01_bin.156]
ITLHLDFDFSRIGHEHLFSQITYFPGYSNHRNMDTIKSFFLTGSIAEATGAMAAEATRTVKAERSVRFMVKAPRGRQ